MQRATKSRDWKLGKRKGGAPVLLVWDVPRTLPLPLEKSSSQVVLFMAWAWT